MRAVLTIGVLLSAAIAAPAQATSAVRAAEGIGYYIAIDGLSTIASGTFAGLVNPNAGRLTWLFDHGNHFHSIGAYSYTGTATSAVVADTNTNNRLPENYSRTDAASSAIALTAGSGAWSGSWVSTVLPEDKPAAEYSLLGVSSIQSLNGLDAAADVLYNSSAGRWSGSATGVTVALQLVTATAGLKVAADNNLDIFAAGAGSLWELGDLNSLSFNPVFYVDSGAAPGVYTAQFSLVNTGSNTAVTSGGNFYFDFVVPAPVPEPSALVMLAAGLGMLALLRRRTA